MSFSFVSVMSVKLTVLWNSLVWFIAFCSVLVLIVSIILCGVLTSSFFITRTIFFNFFIRCDLFCRRSVVSVIRTSILRVLVV